jgi:hypothetical protein
MYNLTNLTSSTDVYGLLVAANSFSDGLVFPLFLMCIFFVSFFAMKRNGMDDAFMVSSFGCFVLSFPLLYAGLINLYVMVAFLAILAFSILYAYTHKG